jgi:hypothetical protein
LIGLAGLTDPVFNLCARDEWIGWTSADRESALVNVMDAHVLGAVPPYNHLLGGKLIASLLASDEVRAEFHRRYFNSKGIISGETKSARLALISVTSALGRSSVYNRLRLRVGPAHVELIPVGTTTGFGHFHVSDSLFDRLRDTLRERGHRYADGHQFGKGPNWRMRVIRAALHELGLDGEILRHGIQRQVFVMPLAADTREYLLGTIAAPTYPTLPVATIADAALARWVVPRSERDTSFRRVTRRTILADMGLGVDTT